MRQISLFDNPDLIGTARFGAKVSPQVVAANYDMMHERSFDDLDYFDFFGFEFAGVRVGIRKHRGNQNDWSYVSLSGFDGNDPKRFLAETLSVSNSDIVVFDESW